MGDGLCTDSRLLTPADIPSAMRLKDSAGWNQTETDWRNVMRLEPEGCFGIERGRDLAATATVVCYGDRLAWIGMVLTLPEFRGQGLARRLMERSIAYAEARGVAWIKLDATDMGRPLYAKLGFADECPIERWGRPAEAPAIAGIDLPPASPEHFSELDTGAFGADRRQLLHMLSAMHTAEIAGKGYAMGRAGAKAAYFGPCVTTSPDAARDLARWWVGRNGGSPVYWDILPSNGPALEIARDLGFTPLRRLVRMVRAGRPTPPEFLHDDARVFAIAGFEYG